MASRAVTRTKLPLPLVFSAALVAVGAISCLIYLGRSSPETRQNGPASPEARSYVSYLTLTDVSMKATENFMKQQVVEIEGKITNTGARAVEAIDVDCLFRGVDGREIYRERVPIVAQSRVGPMKSSETRRFRLAFDNLPDGWNQALPSLVIARITFAG